eukprot:UN34193
MTKGPTAVPGGLEHPDNLPHTMYSDTLMWNGKQLRPAIRTGYRRTVFQEYEGASVRVSFDEDMELTCLSGLSYKESLDPSCKVDENLILRFPLGILEVKQAFNNYHELENLVLPDWVALMCEQGLCIEVEKFSKYITGVSVLHSKIVTDIPSWIEPAKQFMDVEI